MEKGTLNSLPAPAHIQHLLDLFEDEIRTRLMHHKSVERLVAVSYAITNNEGTIYFIKAYIGNNQFIHIKLYFSLPHYGSGPAIASIIPDRRSQEPFVYF